MDQDFENLLSESQLNAYVTYLKLSHTGTSVINRRQSSIKQFSRYCFLQKYIPVNPFEYKHDTPRLAPLSWMERFSSKKNKPSKTGPKKGLALLYQKYTALPFTPYLHLAILVLATSAMVIFGYNQIINQASLSSAAGLPTVPRRQLSFQGRLTDSSGTPIVTAVNVVFKLWNDPTAGSQLYTTGTCSITPDSNGIFNTLIGNGCGAEIDGTVFTNNRDVYLEVAVGAQTLTPRQQIATVGYALNSETLQGYPASASATINTVPIMDGNGNIVLAQLNPSIVATSSSGTFTVRGQTLALQTTAGSGGNIIIQPDTMGAGNIQLLPSAATGNQVRIQDANLTTGNLISGYVGNDNNTGRLLSLTAGSAETDRFYVGANGQTVINTYSTLPGAAHIVNQNGAGDIFTASASGTNKFVISNGGNVGIGKTNPSTMLDVLQAASAGVAEEIAHFAISDDANAYVSIRNNSTTDGAFFPLLRFKGSASNTAANIQGMITTDSGTNPGLVLTSQTAAGAALVTRPVLVIRNYTTDVMDILANGSVGIGITNPGYKLDVQGGQVNASGGLCINGDCRTSWSAASGPWSWSAGVIYPTEITDAINLGNAATNSATVHLAGNSGDNSFINTGNFGIGITNPAASLDILSTTTTGNVMNITNTAVQTAGSMLAVVGNSATTTTNGLVNIAGNGLTTGSALKVTSTGTTTLTGNLVDLSFADTSGTGNLLALTSSGIQTAGSILSITGNTATTTTNGLVKIAGNGLTTGSALVLTSTSTGLTGDLASVTESGSNAAVTGNVLKVGLTGASAVGTALNVTSAGSAGFALRVNDDGTYTDSTPFVVDFAGNVGVGLTNPTYKLDVTGDINLTGALRASGNAGSAGNILSSTGTGVAWVTASSVASVNQGWTWTAGVLYPTEITDAINLGNAATNSATVHLAGKPGDNSFINTGNFGIGTTSPLARFDVRSNLGTVPTASISGATAFASMVVDQSGVGDLFTASTSGITRFVISNSGNVGIGLTNPAYKLDIAGDINLTGGIRAAGSFGVSGYVLSSTGTGVNWIPAATGGGNSSPWNWTAGVIFPFSITDAVNLGNSATSSANVHLAGVTTDPSFVNAGNFGIGTRTPTAALDVNGTASTSGALTFRTATADLINSLNGARLDFQTSTGGDIGLAPKVTIANNGNVGIGTTTPNASAGTNLDISSGTIARFLLTKTGTNAGSAQIYSDGGLNIVSNAGFDATYYRAGSHVWSNNAGSTQYMVIDTSGRLGIGTPTPTALLDVAGAASASGNLVLRGAASKLDILNGSNFGIRFSPGGDTGLVEKFTVTPTGINATNIGATTPGTGAFTTLSSTGVTTIGNGSATVAVNSSTWGVTTAGVASGFTGLSSSGTITFSGLTAGGLVKAGAGTGTLSLATGGTDYEFPLTFSNGITRATNAVKLGGALTANTEIPLAGFNLGFSGTGKVGVGVTTPSQSFDVAGFFVVDTGNSRVGIGTTTPGATLDIGGGSSTISNSSGDITFNSASGLFDFSGGTLKNFLNATASGQVRLAGFADAGRPATNGVGNLIYSTTQNTPEFYNGTAWQTLSNYFSRLTTGTLYATNWYDSINLGSPAGAGASASATVRISPDVANSSFFVNPVAFGFRTDNPGVNAINQPLGGYTYAMQTSGGILPRATGVDKLGYTGYEWGSLYLTNDIVKSGTAVISLNNLSLNTGTWHAATNFVVNSTSAITAGYGFEVAGGANSHLSGTLDIDGQITVGGGTGKIAVGTVDPPYTINGTKYGTYMASMVGVKEETTGNITTTDSNFINGVGYRALIDLDQQPTGSDIWLFSKTTDMQNHINDLSVLLTPEGQAKAWYQVDTANKILAIYSSTPTTISYRLTAPRFDSASWSNLRSGTGAGFVINDPTAYTNTNSIFDNPVTSPELIAKIDGTYSLNVNGTANKEVSSFLSSIIGNLQAGAAVVANLVTTNLTVTNKLISPIADIDQLKTIDATISGTLYADNIQGQTIDTLHSQINLLDSKYSTASAILADLQAKYSTYNSVLGTTSIATVSGDPLALSPLATTSAVIPQDLALNSLNVHTLITNDLMANGSIFGNSISAMNTDFFIQPLADKPVHILADLMTLYPNGKVRVNGDVLITGTIYAQGLDTNTATVSGSLAVGTSTIATGSANFDKLTTGGLVIASGNNNLTGTGSAQTNSNATIGIATIAAGTTEISILNTKITPTTLVYVTPTSDTQGRVLFVKSKTDGVGFTVSLDGNAKNKNDIAFNYWLVETK